MLIASLLHLIAGLLFGSLGFRVHVLVFYGAAALVVVIGAAATTDLSTGAAFLHAVLALFGVSIGFGIGAALAAWRAQARGADSAETQDRLPRLFGSGPWPSIGGGC